VNSTGLNPTRTTLANGVSVIAKETRRTPAATILVSVRAGSVCDPDEQPGAMHLMSRVIDRGTTTRSASDIAEDLDNRGISLTTSVTRHLFSIGCTCLADDFEDVCDLLGDIVRSSTFPDDQLEKRRVEVITRLREDEDNPAIRAVEGLMALLYGADHPYGRWARGTPTSVERIPREILRGLHATRLAPSQTMVIVVGDVEPSQVADVAGTVFGSWSVPVPAPVIVPRARRASERRRVVIPMMNKAQAEIAYGFTALTRSDPRYHALVLANNVLGQYALGGRLGDRIREREGMAYHVSSSFDGNVAEGPLVVRAGVNAANVDRALQSIDVEIAAAGSGGISAAELADSRNYLLGSMPRALETNAGIAQFLEAVEFFDLGLDYDVRLPELLNAVTLDAAQSAAREFLNPDRASIVIAGPYSDT
jgi:zinc protease